MTKGGSIAAHAAKGRSKNAHGTEMEEGSEPDLLHERPVGVNTAHTAF